MENVKNKNVRFTVKDGQGCEGLVERLLNETNDEMLARGATDQQRFASVGIGLVVISAAIEAMDKDNFDSFKPMLMELCEKTTAKAESLRDDWMAGQLPTAQGPMGL